MSKNTTKILSWDVGITNLAYSIIKKNEDNTFEIIKWGILDLTDDRLRCDYMLRTKRVCGNTAKYFVSDKEQKNHTVCKTHMDKYTCDIIEVKDKDNKIQCSNCKQNITKIVDGTDIGWCDKHYEKGKKIYLARVKPKKVPSQKCNDQALGKLTEKMYEKLDNDPEFINVNEVLIENQPTLTNPTMKSIACVLFSYFIMRGLHEKKNNGIMKDVKFISPNNKLKVNDTLTKDMLKDIKDSKTKYEITKKLGMLYCRSIVSKESLNTLDTNDKKDDICDSFLQGFHHLYGNEPVEYIGKLNNIDKSNIEKIREKYFTKTKDKSIINEKQS